MSHFRDVSDGNVKASAPIAELVITLTVFIRRWLILASALSFRVLTKKQNRVSKLTYGGTVKNGRG